MRDHTKLGAFLLDAQGDFLYSPSHKKQHLILHLRSEIGEGTEFDLKLPFSPPAAFQEKSI